MYIVLAIKMYYRSILIHVSVFIYVHVINLLLYLSIVWYSVCDMRCGLYKILDLHSDKILISSYST